MMPEKQQIILTDHNELAQAVEGIESGKIIEVVDHHRFGGLQIKRSYLYQRSSSWLYLYNRN